MTRQIERAYKSNRRRSWLLIAAVVAVAAVIIPIASGAADKNYTLLFPATGATNPAAKASTSLNQTLCTGNTYSVSLTLSNTAKSVSLGSANITFPGNVTISGSLILVGSIGYTIPASATANSTLSSSTNIVSLRDLSMPKGKQLTLTVSLTASATATSALSFLASVKQANDFNDTSGGANTFDNPAMPAITVERCVATIKGQIWNDSNESGAQDSFENSQRPANGFSATLFRKNGLSYDATGIAPTYDLPSGYTGYTFSDVPTGQDYVVCETATTGTWKQTTGALESACGTALPNGWSFTLDGNVTDKNFGNANTVTVDCAIPNSLSPPPIVTADTRYTVRIAGNTCKNGSFVLEAYAPDATKRVANFHPVSGSADKIYLIEKMEWSFSGDLQPDPANRSLKYDDDPTNGIDPLPMQYCVKDPRNGSDPWTLTSTTGILPGTETSCLMTSTERPASTTSGSFRREDWIFSSVDGYRLGP